MGRRNGANWDMQACFGPSLDDNSSGRVPVGLGSAERGSGGIARGQLQDADEDRREQVRNRGVNNHIVRFEGGVRGGGVSADTRPSETTDGEAYTVHGVAGVEGMRPGGSMGRKQDEERASTPMGEETRTSGQVKCGVNGCGFSGASHHGLGLHMKAKHSAAQVARVGQKDDTPPHERHYSSYKKGDGGGAYGKR